MFTTTPRTILKNNKVIHKKLVFGEGTLAVYGVQKPFTVDKLRQCTNAHLVVQTSVGTG